MRIKINGKESCIDGQAISIAELLEKENIEHPDMVSVQLNGEFVDKARLTSTYLKDKDEIEFLYFMGGGAIEPIKRR